MAVHSLPGSPRWNKAGATGGREAGRIGAGEEREEGRERAGSRREMQNPRTLEINDAIVQHG